MLDGNNDPVSFSLKGGTTGNSITIKVPADKSITVTEAYGYYTPSVAEVIAAGEESGLVTPASGKALNVSSAVGASGSTTATFTLKGNASLKFTNDLGAISPTGVTLTYAPYLLMLLFGAMLLMISKRRKVKN